MRRALTMVATLTLAVALAGMISGCMTEAEVQAQPSSARRQFAIPARVTEEDRTENLRLIEVEYNGTAHLFIQPRWGDVKPYQEVGTRPISR